MQYRIFTVPLFDPEAETEALNRFLRTNKVVKVDKQLVECGNSACWTFCVQYLLPQPAGAAPVGERREKVDYKTLLDENQFRVFSLLRKCRKAIADEEAIPAFAVFVDSELAEMSKLDGIDLKSLSAINGVGKQRVEKFGQRLIDKINEESSKPDGSDS